jgi:acyl-CoA synthetase (AMP-forming)/AMP-acid ligase II
MALLYDWLLSAVTERGNAGAAASNALVYRDTYLSWRGLVHRVDRRAQDLRSMGIGPGNWVGLMLGNVPDFVILSLALSKLGAVLVPIDPTTANRDLDMILEAAPLRALITRPRGTDPVAGPSPVGLRVGERAAAARFVPDSRRRLQGTLLNCHLYRREAGTVEGVSDPRVVLFTLDAGGDPKGVVRTDAELAGVAAALGETLTLTPEDRILCTAPLYHGYGFDLGLIALLAHRSTLLLEEEMVVARLAKLIRDDAADLLPATPATYAALVRLPTAKRSRRPRARFISSGSALPPAIAEAFHERYGVRPLSCYHSTEAGPVAIDVTGKAPASVGKAFARVEVRVASADERALPVAATGPVWVRSASVARASVPRLGVALRSTGVPVGRSSSDGWFRTGDLGFADRFGRLVLTGREDDLVKVDGRRVALGEVEGCLEAFAHVRAAQARIEIDDFAGPRVVARVVHDGRCRAEDLIDHCARNLAPYKVPSQIEFCDHLA